MQSLFEPAALRVLGDRKEAVPFSKSQYVLELRGFGPHVAPYAAALGPLLGYVPLLQLKTPMGGRSTPSVLASFADEQMWRQAKKALMRNPLRISITARDAPRFNHSSWAVPRHSRVAQLTGPKNLNSEEVARFFGAGVVAICAGEGSSFMLFFRSAAVADELLWDSDLPSSWSVMQQGEFPTPPDTVRYKLLSPEPPTLEEGAELPQVLDTFGPMLRLLADHSLLRWVDLGMPSCYTDDLPREVILHPAFPLALLCFEGNLEDFVGYDVIADDFVQDEELRSAEFLKDAPPLFVYALMVILWQFAEDWEPEEALSALEAVVRNAPDSQLLDVELSLLEEMAEACTERSRSSGFQLADENIYNRVVIEILRRRASILATSLPEVKFAESTSAVEAFEGIFAAEPSWEVREAALKRMIASDEELPVSRLLALKDARVTKLLAKSKNAYQNFAHIDSLDVADLFSNDPERIAHFLWGFVFCSADDEEVFISPAPQFWPRILQLAKSSPPPVLVDAFNGTLHPALLKELGRQGLVTVKLCDWCQATSAVKSLKLCSRCRGAYFCSVKCQKNAWPRHREKCKETLVQ